MRIDITSFQNLPPSATLDKRECILAREVYEQAIFISVQKEDIASFERNFSILRTYYDELDPIIGLESQRKYTILGLYLLYLLSFNKISEYHTEIELLPFD